MTLLSLVCQKYVQKSLHFKSNPDYNILFRKKKIVAMNCRKDNRDKRTCPGEQTMTKGVFFSENEMEIGFVVFIRLFLLLRNRNVSNCTKDSLFVSVHSFCVRIKDFRRSVLAAI